MNDAKYVVGLYRDPSRRSGPEGTFFQEVTAVVFDRAISHDDMEPLFLGIHSAGFCSISPDTGKVRCFGRSESLDLESVPAVDEYFVTKALRVLPLEGDVPLTTEACTAVIRERRQRRFSSRG